MNKAVLSLWLLTVMAGSGMAQNNCLDLSGVYLVEDQSGQVQFFITQTACTQIRIDRAANVRGNISTEHHNLKIDGQFQADVGWRGSAVRIQTSAKFTSGALEITARPATPENGSDFLWKLLFVVRSNGDLDIREFSRKDDAYIPLATAVRVQ